MAIKQKSRSEINDNYKWDLTTIYKSIDEFYDDYNFVKDSLNSLKEYKDKLMDSADNLYNFLELDTNVSRKLDKLYSYAHLHFDEDTTNTYYQEIYGKVENLLLDYNVATNFFKPTILNYEYDVIEKFYEENSNLIKYKFILEQIFRYKNHRLSDSEEYIITQLSKSLEANYEAFESLTDSDMKFGEITNENGEKVELTESNYAVFIRSKNQKVRKEAFERLFEVYSNYKNTLSSLYKNQVAKECEIAKIYNFDSALEESLFSDNIAVSVYENLIKTVNENLESIYDYYKFRNEKLGFKEHLYDTYVDLINNSSKNYTFDEAKDLVLKATNILGEDYTEIMNKAFTEKWIDIYSNVGKRGGAYSSGCYDTNPFILLNFEGTLDDVSTLAHELGHSAHSYYSRNNNDYNYSNYKIFVAEIASTVNELLLNRYILNNTDDVNLKKLVLNKQLDLFKGTIFRQTMFAEFEKDMHEYYQKGEILTNEFISNKYYELVKKYFGDSVIIDENIKYEWSRIPHFYYNFYVYKYATGLSIANYIVTNILNNKEGYLEKYKNFLKSGSRMYPLDELKIIDVDMSDSKVIESAIVTFKETLNELKELMK